MVAKRKRVYTYIRTHRPMDFWSVFGLWGPQYPVFRFLPPRSEKVKFTFFTSEINALKLSRPREAITISTVFFKYKSESKINDLRNFIMFF